jgi:hypothetical protein
VSANLWARGVVGHVMLAGKLPFYGDTCHASKVIDYYHGVDEESKDDADAAGSAIPDAHVHVGPPIAAIRARPADPGHGHQSVSMRADCSFWLHLLI